MIFDKLSRDDYSICQAVHGALGVEFRKVLKCIRATAFIINYYAGNATAESSGDVLNALFVVCNTFSQSRNLCFLVM